MVKKSLNLGITTYAILLLPKEKKSCLKQNPLYQPMLSTPSSKYIQHLTSAYHLCHSPAMLKVITTSCLDYIPLLPSNLPASSVTFLQSLFCIQSSPLKPSQIMPFPQNLSVAPSHWEWKAEPFLGLGGLVIQAFSASDFILQYSSPFFLPPPHGPHHCSS